MAANGIKVKPSLLYIHTCSGFMCKICGLESRYQSNMVRHVNSHASDHSPDDYSIFTYNKNNILKITEKILLWKCAHGIPMNAFIDDLITSLFPEGSLYSD